MTPSSTPMKGTEIPEVKCCTGKFLTVPEQNIMENALDKIGFSYFSVWFGYPIREPKNIRKDLSEAKQLLSQIKCPEVI